MLCVAHGMALLEGAVMPVPIRANETIFVILSETLVSRGSYRLYMGVTGSMSHSSSQICFAWLKWDGFT